jgi:RHS repeat-associated protein
LQSDGKEYHYVGDILYVKLNAADELKTYQIGHDEGRIVSDGTDLVYEYAYHDHQGNLRVSFIDSAGVAVVSQQNDYDPWGLPLVGLDRASRFANANFYGFNGQEQLEAGYQNMGWRWYDKTNGRMTGIDPMNQFASGYVGLGNNPVSLTDPDGRFVPLVIAGAALVGGAINLYSNWGKIKDGDWKAGAAYFVSGAIGGAVSVANPLTGGAITGAANATIDVLTGNFPDIHNPSAVVNHIAGNAITGMVSSKIGASVGVLVGPYLQSVFKWTQTGFANATQKTIQVAGQQYTYFVEAGVKLTKSLFQSVGGSVGRAMGKGGVQLGKAELKAISTYKNLISEHQSKLAEYINNPMKFDNKGLLKNAPNDAVRQKIIQKRINHLNHEINTFQGNIQKILNGQ